MIVAVYFSSHANRFTNNYNIKFLKRQNFYLSLTAYNDDSYLRDFR